MKSKTKSIPLQDEQEPEGEDLVDSEEYEEDEEEERLRKKRKKDSRYGGFIIDEAEVIILDNFSSLVAKCKYLIIFVCIIIGR